MSPKYLYGPEYYKGNCREEKNYRKKEIFY